MFREGAPMSFIAPPGLHHEPNGSVQTGSVNRRSSANGE